MAKESQIYSYRDLIVWQRAMDLAVEANRLTRAFPSTELFGARQQIRRSAASVAANIAEGYGRYSTREYLRFIAIANGSLKECETHVHLAHRLGYVTSREHDDFTDLGTQVGRLLLALRRALLRRKEGRPK